MTASRRTVGLLIVSMMLALTVAPAFAQKSGQTASQFYTEYRAAFDKAKTIDDLLPYMAKKTRDQIEATPAADRPKMFGMVKMMGALTEMKIVKETKTPEGATLTVEGLDPDKKKTTGKVEILKENGAWKLGTESWSSSS